MTLKERLKNAGTALTKYNAASASVVRGKVRWLKSHVASMTPGMAKLPPRFGSKYIIFAMATVIIGICAIVFIRKGPHFALWSARSARPSKPMSKIEPPAQKLAAKSLMLERMTRSCENLAEPKALAKSSTADTNAIAVCRQFGLWK